MRSALPYLMSLGLCISQGLDAVDTVHLATPDLSPDAIIGYNVGIRPYRSSGIRIEAVSFQDKLIVHNYGHGGAGITLSWGSAQRAIALMQDAADPSPGSPIAVLGAGVIGLTVAHQLLERGYNVRIYAKDFPPETTSNIAAGLWAPYGLPVPASPEAERIYQEIVSSSYGYFYDLATSEQPQLGGVYLVDGYSLSAQGEVPVADVDEVRSGYDLVHVEFDNSAPRLAVRGKRIMIETPTYLSNLMHQVWEMGAEFIQDTVVESDDLLEFSEEIIFNCTGLGSRELFNDTDLRGVRGHLIYLRAQEGVDYFAYAPGPQDGPAFCCVFPYKAKVIIGGTYEEGEEERVFTPGMADEILDLARRVFAPTALDLAL